MASQIARLAVVLTIVTTTSLSSAKELKAYGATHVTSRQASDIEEQMRSIVGGELIYVLDCTPVGIHNLALSLSFFLNVEEMLCI